MTRPIWRDRWRVASLIGVAYLLFVFGGLLIHAVTTGDAGALRFSLGLASLWAVLLVGLLIAAGLWRHLAWAWWLGLLAGGWQLARVVTSFAQYLSQARVDPSTLVARAFAGALLIAFVVTLLLSRPSRGGRDE